jgi:hypothetical protein
MDKSIDKLLIAVMIVTLFFWIGYSIYLIRQEESYKQEKYNFLKSNPSPEELYKFWFCKTPDKWSKAEFNATNGVIYLTCPTWFWPNSSKLKLELLIKG